MLSNCPILLGTTRTSEISIPDLKRDVRGRIMMRGQSVRSSQTVSVPSVYAYQGSGAFSRQEKLMLFNAVRSMTLPTLVFVPGQRNSQSEDQSSVLSGKYQTDLLRRSIQRSIVHLVEFAPDGASTEGSRLHFLGTIQKSFETKLRHGGSVRNEKRNRLDALCHCVSFWRGPTIRVFKNQKRKRRRPFTKSGQMRIFT